MSINKYGILTILIILVFVPFLLEEQTLLAGRNIYFGLAPLLITGFLYLPFAFQVRKANRYSETSAMLSTLSLILGVGIQAFALVLDLFVQSDYLGLAMFLPLQFLAIVLAAVAMVYQIGAYFVHRR